LTFFARHFNDKKLIIQEERMDTHSVLSAILGFWRFAEQKCNCFSPFRHLLSSFSSHCMVLRRVLFFSFSFSYFFFHCSAVSSTLTQTVFLMVFALHRKTKEL
uniref:Uncharacterized protein n=1 Tax=Bubo bubo TaxID=30461 RepID=A0A8C0F472_BUBBB